MFSSVTFSSVMFSGVTFSGLKELASVNMYALYLPAMF